MVGSDYSLVIKDLSCRASGTRIKLFRKEFGGRGSGNFLKVLYVLHKSQKSALVKGQNLILKKKKIQNLNFMLKLFLGIVSAFRRFK